MQYGGPHTMTLKGSNTITFKNIMIGEVWICSGQSNMEWSLDRVNNATEEISNSNHAQIRLFKVKKRLSQHPQNDMESGEWMICSPETSAKFTAVGYFFGRALQADLKVSIGLIQSAVGGTVVETWMSKDPIQVDPDFKDKYKELVSMDIEAVEKEKTDAIKKELGGELLLKDNSLIDEKWAYAAIDLDDSNWRNISISKVWDEQGYAKIDGYACYRKVFTLTKKEANNNYKLHLGKIDDSDMTWVNGIKIGETKKNLLLERVYSIPSDILVKGKNVITVRVNDGRETGGFYDTKKVLLTNGNKNIEITGDWKIKFTEVSLRKTKMGANSYPTLLFNGMINPLIPYAIKGVIWYQGESNANRAKQYQRIFPNMITDWRTQWKDDDFPFLFVSLANFKPAPEQPEKSAWAELREAQTMALDLKVTGMAMAIDLGSATTIHPKNKQDVGRRLELAALNKGYRRDIVYSGPMYKSMETKNNKIEITFDHIGRGLHLKNRKKDLLGFSIAGKDKKFHWAKAKITADNRVIVWCDKVIEPIAVRYAWAANPGSVNLYNKEGLPTNPFRTDSWKGLTE